MIVHFSDAAKQTPEGNTLLEQANEDLKEVVFGRLAEDVTAEWDRTQDASGRTLYSLKLRNSTGEEAENQFTPEELARPRYRQHKMGFLWDDVLKALTHKLLRQMHEAGNPEK